MRTLEDYAIGTLEITRTGVKYVIQTLKILCAFLY
jgi:hypothetical protein